MSPRIKGVGVVFLLVACAILACCNRTPPQSNPVPRKPQQAGQPLDPHVLAKHVAGAEQAALTGDSEGVQKHSRAIADDLSRAQRIPDVSRPIDPEAARTAVRPIKGVRSAVWVDRANLLVMVDGSQHRRIEMIDVICLALEPLGDTLAVVVNLQDITASNSDEAATLSRNCQLPEGQRAWNQAMRQIDVVSREERQNFKAQQAGAPTP